MHLVPFNNDLCVGKSHMLPRGTSSLSLNTSRGKKLVSWPIKSCYRPSVPANIYQPTCTSMPTLRYSVTQLCTRAHDSLLFKCSQMYFSYMPPLMMTASPSWMGHFSNVLLGSGVHTIIWKDPVQVKVSWWQLPCLYPSFLPQEGQRYLSITKCFC